MIERRPARVSCPLPSPQVLNTDISRSRLYTPARTSDIWRLTSRQPTSAPKASSSTYRVSHQAKSFGILKSWTTEYHWRAKLAYCALASLCLLHESIDECRHGNFDERWSHKEVGMMLCSPSNLAVYTFQQKSSLINHNATVSLHIFPSKSLQLADILQHNNRAICRHRRVLIRPGANRKNRKRIDQQIPPN